MTIEHKTIPAANRHGPHAWEVADQTARLALTTLTADIGKTCWQKSDNTVWICTVANTWAGTGVAIEQVNAAIAAAKVTWTQLLALTGMVQGDIRMVTNVGNGSMWIYNGTRWVPVNGQVVLTQTTTDATKTDANTSVLLAGSFVVLGGLLGPNDSLEYEFKVAKTGVASTTVNINPTFGSTVIAGNNLGSGLVLCSARGILSNKGATNVQYGTGNNSVCYGQFANAGSTGAEDTTADKTFGIAINFSSSAGGGATAGVLKHLVVRLLRN